MNYGPNNGKLVTIIDVVNGTKCYVDGPTSGVDRQMISYRQIALTDFKVCVFVVVFYWFVDLRADVFLLSRSM